MTDDTWCVYKPEFVAVYTTEQRGQPGREECSRVFTARYAGKVHPDDWNMTVVGNLPPHRWQLNVRLPNLKGEYRDEKQARALAKEMGGVCVAWGSPEEEELLDYGVKQLSTA